MNPVAVSSPRVRGLTSKQVMSLLGIVPIGAYVFAHLWTNMYSLGGAEAFDQRLHDSRSSPFFIFLEAALGLALVVHAFVGLRIILRMRPNNLRYPTFRNLKYVLQRLSGLGLLLFIVAHVIKARIMPAYTPAGMESWQGMHEALSEPDTFTIYCLGLLGVSYHLANGVWGSAMTLGLAVSPAAQRRVELISAGFLVLLLTMSALALYGFRPFMS